VSVSVGTRLGSYEVTSQIGEGGMGLVFKAKDFQLGREVALKVLPEGFTADPERLARFEREAKLLASLNHPNIAQIYGLETSGGSPALVMELVEGPTLADRLAQGSLPIDETLSIARQIAEALEEAHEKGIVHRDLKPQNVKASMEGKVKVLDFGLAKAMEPAGAASSSGPATVSPTLMNSPTLTSPALGTVAGVILGTAAYMSPEQAKGRAVDKRADIWAFGVVLWEMLTGRRLFEAESVPETLAAIFSRDLSPAALPDGVPEAVRRLVGRCLERDPLRRLRDIGEARLVLETPFGEDAPRETRPGPLTAIGRRSGRVGWLAAALLAVAVAVLAVRARAPVPRPEMIRFSISSASGAVIAPGAGNSAISPDGRRVAFVGSDAEGRQGIWIEELDRVRARLLPGTEGASYPFWAPDSRRLGFFAQSKLRKISIDGGQVETICDAIEGRGGSWSRDGTIVFAPTVAGPLWAVAEGGGAPRPATRFENPAEETSHRFPAFLPDGRRFLYIADPGADIEEGRVFLASLDGGERRLLYRSRRAPVFAEPGYLVDAIGDRLVARPFDPKTGELRGAPQRLEEVTPSYVNTQDRAASVSATGVLLVAASGSGRAKIVSLDRRGRQLGEIPLPEGSFSTPRLSPDGSRLALVAGHEDQHDEDLWVVELTSERASRLTFATGTEAYPVWSPDGSRIVFQSDRSGVNDLWIRPSSAGGEERLLFASPTAWKEPRSWIGDTLAFVTTERETGFDIWLLHPDRPGEPPVRLLGSPASEFDAAISPDEKWLAYASNESGRQQLYVVELPAAQAKYQVTTDGGHHPVWTRNGSELVYLSAENRVTAVPVVRGGSLAFGAPETLFPLPRLSPASASGEVLFDVSADGGRFVLLEAQGEDAETLTVVTDWLGELAGDGVER
jgi:Tol biopolymer transport system component